MIGERSRGHRRSSPTHRTVFDVDRGKRAPDPGRPGERSPPDGRRRAPRSTRTRATYIGHRHRPGFRQSVAGGGVNGRTTPLACRWRAAVRRLSAAARTSGPRPRGRGGAVHRERRRITDLPEFYGPVSASRPRQSLSPLAAARECT